MKKLILATTMTLIFSTSGFAEAGDSIASKKAQHTEKFVNENKTRNDLVGMGSGALAGALVGGPIGGIIGGVFGILVANDVNREQAFAHTETQLDTLAHSLSKQEQDFLALQQEYARLEQSQMIQLASIDTKVATEWMRDLPNLESNVQFKTASFAIDDAYKGQLNSLAGLLTQYPNLSVQLSGYADMRGDSEYNRILSEQRAKSVKRHLLAQGVKPQQIIAQGQGELPMPEPALTSHVAEHLASDNTSSQLIKAPSSHEALFFDRRVTLKLISEQASMTAAN